MGRPAHGDLKIYCTGPDCLKTRWAHLDPVDARIVLCDYCGRPMLLRVPPPAASSSHRPTASR